MEYYKNKTKTIYEKDTKCNETRKRKKNGKLVKNIYMKKRKI